MIGIPILGKIVFALNRGPDGHTKGMTLNETCPGLSVVYGGTRSAVGECHYSRCFGLLKADRLFAITFFPLLQLTS